MSFIPCSGCGEEISANQAPKVAGLRMEAVVRFARTAAIALALIVGASTSFPAAANIYDQVPNPTTWRTSEYNTYYLGRPAYAGRAYYRAGVAYGVRPYYGARPYYRYRYGVRPYYRFGYGVRPYYRARPYYRW